MSGGFPTCLNLKMSRADPCPSISASSSAGNLRVRSIVMRFKYGTVDMSSGSSGLPEVVGRETDRLRSMIMIDDHSHHPSVRLAFKHQIKTSLRIALVPEDITQVGHDREIKLISILHDCWGYNYQSDHRPNNPHSRKTCGGGLDEVGLEGKRCKE
jgi:hypothetical protein